MRVWLWVRKHFANHLQVRKLGWLGLVHLFLKTLSGSAKYEFNGW